jgi:hypothetical protein
VDTVPVGGVGTSVAVEVGVSLISVGLMVVAVAVPCRTLCTPYDSDADGLRDIPYGSYVLVIVTLSIDRVADAVSDVGDAVPGGGIVSVRVGGITDGVTLPASCTPNDSDADALRDTP